jgi:hypothetical protein
MILKSFFINLSERLYDENSLSDITWALAKADHSFMKTFMEVFGFDFKLEEPWEIYREISENNSRPDFRVEQGDKEYIIENKINDPNKHFQEYAKKFPLAKRGFIANYAVEQDVAQKYGFTCTTWEKFIKVLSEEIKETDFKTKHESILMRQAYIEYVREVCTIMDIKEMRLENIVSLYYFNSFLKKVIQAPIEDYECWLYNKGSSFDDSSSGRYFRLRRKGGKTEIYPWFGLWYGEENPSIFICFYKDWCSQLYKKYDVKKSKGIYFDKAYYDKDNNNAITFELSDKSMQEFL